MKKYAKIIDNQTKICEVGLGTNTEFYKKMGMEEMEVEQAYNGNWYVLGYSPQKPQEIINQERIEELKALLADADYWGQKYIDGEYTAEEWEQKKAQRKAWRAEIRELEDAEKEIDGTDNSDGG